MELTRIWDVLRRRKWLAIQAVVFVTLIACVGSYFIIPTYQSSAKIVIKRAQRNAESVGGIGLSSLSSIITTSPDVDVNKVLATSKPIIDIMVVKLQLRDHQGNLLGVKKLTQAGMSSALKRKIFPKPHITMTQYQDTEILQITAASARPEEVMMMANTLAETMVQENQNQMRKEYRSAKEYLNSEIRLVKQRYDDALRNLMDFRKEEKTVDLSLETKLATEKMAELMQQKEDNIIELAQARAKRASLKKQLAQQHSNYLSSSALQENPQIEILKRRLTDVRIQLAEAKSELTEKHPEVRSLRKQVQIAEAELEQEIRNYRALAPQLEQLDRQIASLEAHLRGVDIDIEKYSKMIGTISDKGFRQANLDLNLDVTQTVLGTLLDYQYQVGIAEATTLSEIRVVDPAVKPGSPVSPRILLNGVLGAFLGLIFGVGLTFLAEYLDDTIKTPGDIMEFKPLTLLGTIPRFMDNGRSLISTRDPSDPLYESYRSLRLYLNYGGLNPLKSLLIVCAAPGEGKSTTVINLGLSNAQDGKKVAVLDTDLRRPCFHTILGLSNEVGVAEILSQTTSIGEAIQEGPVQGMSVITSGSPCSDPGKLIESEKMGRLVLILKNEFDLVIMDSAPLLVNSDALALARHSDGLIILIESGRTTRSAVHGLVETLEKAKIKPLGFILNKMPMEKGKYYSSQYYYGPGYSSGKRN